MKTNELSLLAFDVGAESGRGIIGYLSDSHLRLEEIHRFNNGPIRVGDHLYTDILNIWNEIQCGLQKAGGAVGSQLASVGVDTWGVDYVLLDHSNQLIGNPFHYRDHRTDGMIEKVLKIIPAEELYFQTGNQFVQFNSLFQLAAMQMDDPSILDRAETFLMLPDLLHLWLSGIKSNELSNATTTQCYNQMKSQWSWEVLEKLQIPGRLFKDISIPSTCLGPLQPWLAEKAGLSAAKVILPASHDTSSAITAIPVTQDDFMYISSGTWSLVGVELDRPNITRESLKYNITNEGSSCNRTCFLQLIPGMWILQQCRQEWKRAGNNFSYDELIEMAETEDDFGSFIDVNAAEFLDPGDMPTRIKLFCERTGQPIPNHIGQIVRCILESLACQYLEQLEKYEIILQKKLKVIHIIGGGSKNKLLNQLTANYTGVPVIAGPVETTAIGNLLVQAMGLGYIQNLSEIRQIVQNSFSPITFEPIQSDRWLENYYRFKKLLR